MVAAKQPLLDDRALLVQEREQFVETPNVIGTPRFHCWRDAERLMDSAEVVVHVMKRDRCFQILNLFRKRIGQAGEAALEATMAAAS
jgi:hypothetical protein